MSCPNPPAIARGEYAYTNAMQVKYTCMDGYSIQGFDTLTCTSGAWSPSEVPMCLTSWARNPNVESITDVPNETFESSVTQLEGWMLYVFMALGGSVLLLLLLTLLLCWFHQWGWCDGPLVGFGGKYVYSDRHACCCCSFDWFIKVCCSCRCRACRKNKKKKTPKVQDANSPLTEIKVEGSKQKEPVSKQKKISLMKPFKTKKKKSTRDKKSADDNIPLKQIPKEITKNVKTKEIIGQNKPINGLKGKTKALMTLTKVKK